MGPWAWTLLLVVAPEQAPPVAIEWVAPAACPSHDVVSARVGARLRPASAPGASARLEVHETADGFSLALGITIGGAVTDRVIEAPHCDELVDAAALVIAVAVDPVFVTTEVDVAALVAEAEPVAIAVPPELPMTEMLPRRGPARPREPTPTRVPAPLRIGLRASVGGWFGAMPRPATAIAVDFVVPASRIVRAEVGALAIPRQRVSASASAGADLWLATAVVRGCIAPILGSGTKGLARVRPRACVGVAVGAIGGRGRGDGIDTTAARELWVSPTIASGIEVAIVRRLGVFAGVDGHVHARLPGFHLDGVGPVHRVGQTSLTALVGLQAVLP